MQGYTEEEAAILCGFVGSYFNRDSVCESARTDYIRLSDGIKQSFLEVKDYLWVERVMQFLEPQWWLEREDHQALSALLLKTQAIIRAKR